MINLIATESTRKLIPVERVREKLNLAYNHSPTRFHLSNLTFDHRYTKPIDLTGLSIISILYMTEIDVFIGLYTQNYFKWKFTPVNAYKPSNKKNQIFFNKRQIPKRSLDDWEETLWHELVHIADSLSNFKFDHGDNDPSGDEESAPRKFAKFMVNLNRQEN